jgi:hypothetical protein
MIEADDNPSTRDECQAGAGWRKFGVLLLAFAAVGLPVNDFSIYAPLLVLTVIVFTGEICSCVRAWLAAFAIVSVVVAGQIWLAPPRIDEGHNLFLPGGPTQALERGLPTEVYGQLAAEFDKQYPPEQHCRVEEAGCWLNMGFPDRVFAFSADGIFHKSDLSRAVTGISFSDPVWLRLGFINEYRYNWYPVSDVQRASRDRRFWMGLQRWHLTMPWFEMIRLPAAYAGGELCWRGDLMWEGTGEHFSLLQGDHCRTIEPTDAGRRIFGIAIKPDSLAMRLAPPWSVWLLQVAQGALAIGALFSLILALVSLRARRLIVPFVLIGLAVAVITIHDRSFLGGVRPFDGGDDGIFYEGVGRLMLQSLLAGDYVSYLIGFEKVFYYGGPALRYFRALEHILFGESFLGYLSLILLMPLMVYALFRRFMSDLWALGLGLTFVAIPIGHLFGTTFIDYLEAAERGYADPAAYILFIAGLIPLLGAKTAGTDGLGSNGEFAPALFGGLLIALGVAMKPIIAPAAAVFLGGAGLAAIYFRQWRRLAGMSIGFLPVLLIPLHNWVFGHVFVLFSTNATHSLVLNMPPAAYADAFRELITFDFGHGQLLRALMKIREWMLSGPYQSSRIVIPINAAAVAILIYVVLWGRRFDPWLRLIGGAAIAQHTVAFFYVSTARYHFLTWFLTALVVVVFAQEVGIEWVRSRFPNLSARLGSFPSVRGLASGLAWLKQ